MSLGARSFATLAMLLASATFARASGAIVGGSDVPVGRWPDAVAIFGTAGSCTGTLIAPDLVLTAGHCAAINPTHIIANTIDYSKTGGIHINVAKTTAYPNWKDSYDVAVIELVAPIQGIEPRKLGMACTMASFTRSEAPAVHLVGFGSTSLDGTASNSKLLEAMTDVTDPLCMDGRGCKKALAPGGEFVAGGTGTADSCFGDSGGPVYLDTANGAVAIASVSRGVDGAATACGGGGIYVRTDKVVDWIEETTGRTVAKDDCAGEDYASEDAADPNDKSDEVGCNAGGSSGLGTLLLLAAGVVIARRRRPGQSRHRHAQTNQIREVERDRRRGVTGESRDGRGHIVTGRRGRAATNQERSLAWQRQQRLARVSSPGLVWGESLLGHLSARAAQ